MTAYDAIAEWYETSFLAGQREDPLAIRPAVRELLGPGDGPCLEVGCGTGVHAELIRSLGRTPLGVDVSEGMLRYASGRLPVARGDAVALPFASGALPAVVIRPGYREAGWTTASWTDQGLRDKVGAAHLPLPELLHAVLDAGLTFERFAEGGEPSPMVLAWRAKQSPGRFVESDRARMTSS
ncbi:methyltransferase domain-containing protein [Amycolatopsis sp., V23-08]|uniref:Methyltransferase domain-containing protein n=1 Tax=Amycolatopsis heterodermiae TaxID=3110235 RepID=A0ABU5R693_9PSEU|nr:methyltransferase domain-containing protein [Amycolatopsis sp., V23-08]MEA5361180.1 methyltransferase domain-containing protein [Amycolatopsis sp., V23-08]